MDSSRRFTELINELASAPSMILWSKLMHRFIMDRIAIPSPDYHRTLHNCFCRKNGCLGEVDQGLTQHGPEYSCVVQRERPALDVV